MDSNNVSTTPDQTINLNYAPIRYLGKEAQIIFVTGRATEGKSFWIKKRFELVPQRIIWDYNFEYKIKAYYTHKIDQLKTLWENRQLPIVYQPYQRNSKEFEDFIKTIHLFFNCLVVLEEFGVFTSSNSMPQSFRAFLGTARHRGIGICCTNRRSVGIPRDIPYNAHHILAFKQHLTADLDYLAQYMNPAKVYLLPDIPRYWYIHYYSMTGKTFLRQPI